MYECVRVCFFVEWMEVHEQLHACHVYHVRCMQTSDECVCVYITTSDECVCVYIATSDECACFYTHIRKRLLEKLNLKLSETIHKLTNYCKCKQVHPGETPASWIMHGNL